MKIINYTFLFAVVLLFSCKTATDRADAFGNFEADEIIVSSETSGKLLQLNVKEGEVLGKGAVTGVVDTVMIALQYQQTIAQKQKVLVAIQVAEAQAEILEQQRQNRLKDAERIENMFKSGASTQKQLDDINGAVAVIDKQIKASEVQIVMAKQDLSVIDAEEKLLKEKLYKCKIINPQKGIVLEKYAYAGEVVVAGKPVYKIADTKNIVLKAYVSGGMLHKVRLGAKCKVRIDKGEKGYVDYSGIVRFVSDKAEFTPKIIQTKEERVNMVYAVKIDVKNDGQIKIGMPGEVIF